MTVKKNIKPLIKEMKFLDKMKLHFANRLEDMLSQDENSLLTKEILKEKRGEEVRKLESYFFVFVNLLQELNLSFSFFENKKGKLDGIIHGVLVKFQYDEKMESVVELIKDKKALKAVNEIKQAIKEDVLMQSLDLNNKTEETVSSNQPNILIQAYFMRSLESAKRFLEKKCQLEYLLKLAKIDFRTAEQKEMMKTWDEEIETFCMMNIEKDASFSSLIWIFENVGIETKKEELLEKDFFEALDNPKKFILLSEEEKVKLENKINGIVIN